MELYHYGIPHRSGRYPYGSGDRPYQDREEKRMLKRRQKYIGPGYQLNEAGRKRIHTKIKADTTRHETVNGDKVYSTSIYVKNNAKAVGKDYHSYTDWSNNLGKTKTVSRYKAYKNILNQAQKPDNKQYFDDKSINKLRKKVLNMEVKSFKTHSPINEGQTIGRLIMERNGDLYYESYAAGLRKRVERG